MLWRQKQESRLRQFGNEVGDTRMEVQRNTKGEADEGGGWCEIRGIRIDGGTQFTVNNP